MAPGRRRVRAVGAAVTFAHMPITDAMRDELLALEAWLIDLETRGLKVKRLRLPARCRAAWPDGPGVTRFADIPVVFPAPAHPPFYGPKDTLDAVEKLVGRFDLTPAARLEAIATRIREAREKAAARWADAGR